MRLESRVQAARTARATAATPRVRSALPRSGRPAARDASSWAIAPSRAIFASSDTHWHSTFPAMYFRLSGTAAISRLLIILRSSPKGK